MKRFYLENSPIKIEVIEGEPFIGAPTIDLIVNGSKIDSDANFVKNQQIKFWNKHKKITKLIFDKSAFSKLDEKEKKKAKEYYDKKSYANDSIWTNFIKNNPKAHYSIYMFTKSTHGKSIEDVMTIYNYLDPKLQQHAEVQAAIKRIKDDNVGNKGIKEIFKVENVNYKVDEEFRGEDYKGVIYLSAFSNNNVCALSESGEISILDPSGKKIKSIKTDFDGKISAIAVDGQDRIHVIARKSEMVEVNHRGKKMMRRKLVDCNCVRLDKNGNKEKSFVLNGAKDVTGLKVVNNMILVSEARIGQIRIYNANNGELMKEMNGMRQCCGILDFSMKNEKEILVGNLGAFRVESFNLDGSKNFSFGKRGRGWDDFHGCCNPVSVAPLSNGAIVTVEKDPTRIKVYSKDGAKQIQGIQELVQGCSYIPMTVDSHDNLYLASPKKGLVKCIAM
jgi:hypothetical protein